MTGFHILTAPKADKSNEQEVSFEVAYPNRKGGESRSTCYLFQDGDKFYALCGGTMLKSVYTAADTAERYRLNKSNPVRSGDRVSINGKEYVAKVNGAFSDAAVFLRAH